MALQRSERWLGCGGCVVGLGWVAAVCFATVDTSVPARTRAPKKVVVALSPWALAERGREAVEAIPEDARTKADYARAMDAYRAIYHENPRDGHAPAAVNAVAELLEEQGRTLHDAKSLQAAVGQYEFLRKQYPGSSLGVQALLAEGQIEQNELGDAATAKEKYKLLLKEHPKSELAEEAKAGLASLGQGSGFKVQGSGTAGQDVVAGTHVSEARHGAPDLVAAPAVVTETKTASVPAVSGQRSVVGGGSALPAMAQTSGSSGSIERRGYGAEWGCEGC